MLLKKIFYGYTRVRYVMVQKNETDKEVSFTFCRWRPLGPKPGEYSWKQYTDNTYVRKNPYKTLKRISKVTKSSLWWGYDGSWHVIFHSPQIKEIIFRRFLNNLWFVWFVYIIWMVVFNGK